MTGVTTFWLERWDERAPAFERRANTPEMQVHLGGVESEDAIVSRHERILDGMNAGTGEHFLIMIEGEADPVGSVGYWAKEWLGEPVWELGWKVLTGFQGRGLAVGATVETLLVAATNGRRRWAHAYPDVANAGSNAVCRRVGFELQREAEFEYPKGRWIRCNDWRFDLLSVGGSGTAEGIR